jgi:7,8-dihydroneopterin aldolase/epimerase/oxygenase
LTDRIQLHRIAVYAYHGDLPEEARTGQRFYISLDCALDLSAAGKADDLARTVSYAELAELAVAVATGRRFRLIEALAEAIAADALARFPRLDAITVAIEKPAAPIPTILDGVTVAITRARRDA